MKRTAQERVHDQEGNPDSAGESVVQNSSEPLERRSGESGSPHASQIELEVELRRARREVRMLSEALLQLSARLLPAVDLTGTARPRETEGFYPAEWLEQVLTSTSWRITVPLRFAVTVFGAACHGNWRTALDWSTAWRRARQPFLLAPSPPSIVSSLPRTPPRTGRALIAFVSGLAYLPSETYRIGHPIAVLREGFDTLALTEEALYANPAAIGGAAVLVLFRTGFDARIFDIVAWAQANGCLVVYDADDLVFDPVVAGPRFIDSIRSATGWGVQHYRAGVTRTLELVKRVDACTVSTAYLAARMAALGKAALVLPNGFSAAMLDRFERARVTCVAPADGKPRIGYASGTRTHQRDFAAAKDAVLRILKARDDVLFTVIGALDLSEYPEFAEVDARIERRPLVPLDELPLELARLDINLAPLELGNPFCEAKSELKFFDAAFLEIPTIASPISGYWAVIRHGANGYLADQPTEWFSCIQALLDDQDLRRRLGRQARCDALRQFGPDAMRENVNEIYRSLLEQRPGR